MYCSLPTPCLLACLLSPAWSQVLTEFGSTSTDKESPEVLENRYSKPFPYYFLNLVPKESPLFRCTSSPSILLPTSARCDRYPDCPSGEVRQEYFLLALALHCQDELGCDQWFKTDWSGDTPTLGPDDSEDSAVGQPWTPPAMAAAQSWPQKPPSNQWNGGDSSLAPAWTRDGNIDNLEVGQAWARSPDRQNITEAFPYYPSDPYGYQAQLQEYPDPENYQTPRQPYYSAQYPPAVPYECLAPPPSCPIGWVRPRPRWYYNPSLATCTTFQYYCGEGSNNFHSQDLCSSYCQASASLPAPSISSMPKQSYPSVSFPSQSYQPQLFPSPSFPSSSYSSPSYQSPSYPSSSIQASDVPILTASTLPTYIDKNNNLLVEFYTKWCGACQAFEPKFQQIAYNLR